MNSISNIKFKMGFVAICISVILPVADAALSVPDKYENLLYEVRERIVVEAGQVDKTPSKSCNSLSGPFCHRVDPAER